MSKKRDIFKQDKVVRILRKSNHKCFSRNCRRKKEKSKEKDNLVLGYSGMIDELAI
jgi:hypothetical protein